MGEQTLRQKLEWFGVTLNEPENGSRGYRSLLMQAVAEIDRLNGLQAPVTCFHCKREIERAGDWYRCADCGGHYHKGCIAAHARDWKPSHPTSTEEQK
jgi:tRNA(Ile2) C34 agmatinyltransferase TiaS